MGLEPMALRLKVWCSTDWANKAYFSSPHIYYIHLIFKSIFFYLNLFLYLKYYPFFPPHTLPINDTAATPIATQAAVYNSCDFDDIDNSNVHGGDATVNIDSINPYTLNGTHQ